MKINLSTSNKAKQSMEQKKKKKYKKPTLTTFGTIADLTKFGKTEPGADTKTGCHTYPHGQ